MQAAPFLAIAGPLFQGVAGLSAGNANAARARQQASEERRATEAEIRATKDDVRRQIGEQLAAQVSNGLEGGTGSALDALRESQVEGALDVMELRRTGRLRARALETGADDAEREGEFGLLSGVLGAGSSYLKMRSDWAQERLAGG